MEDCAEYSGKPEDLTGSNTPGSSGIGVELRAPPSSGGPPAGEAASSSTRSSGAAPPAPPAGEVDCRPGTMAISEQRVRTGRRDAGPVHLRQRQHQPAAAVAERPREGRRARAVRDRRHDQPARPGGIRWIVGDIDPTSKGVAAGATPAGGIVGTNTQGHGRLRRHLPAHGKTATIEFVLYALRKKIPLTPGFQPTTAESEYGAGKLLMAQAAVTYAEYHRP